MSRLSEFSKILDADTIITKVIPNLKHLVNDQFAYVRSALAENILSICPIIERAPTNEHILPDFLTMLRDENSEVRLNLFKRLEELNKVIGLENLEQSIIPSLTDLSQDKNWRIKLSVVEQFPTLAKQLGEQFFNDKLNPICVTWLSDSIFTIREAAIENIRQLTGIFGHAWAARHIIPKLLALHTDANYLHRLTPLFGICALSRSVTQDIMVRQFFPVLATLQNDRVANIRMNVAKAIGKLATTP